MLDQPQWTEDRIAQLRKLWSDGLSCGQIAAVMACGFSRNAIIGKATRLKLPKRSKGASAAMSRAARHPHAVKPTPRASQSEAAEDARAASRIARRKRGDKNGGGGIAFAVNRARKAAAAGEPFTSAADAILGAKTALEPPQTIIDTETRVISLLELTTDTCKWPIGDPQDAGFGFCGCQPLKGRPYCAKHHQRGTSTVAQSRVDAEVFKAAQRVTSDQLPRAA